MTRILPILSIILACGLVTACVSDPDRQPVSSAQLRGDGADCMVSEQRNCLQVTTIVVRNDPSHHEVASLVDGHLDGLKASSVAKDSRPGESLQRETSCRKFLVYAWGTNRSVPVTRIGIYNASRRDQMDRTEGRDVSGSYPVTLLNGTQRADFVLAYETCGGKGGFQVPKELITPSTHFLICPWGQDDVLYPHLDNLKKGERAGTWLYSDRLAEMLEKRWTWTTTPVVVR